MPIEALIDHPKAVGLRSAPYGMLLRLLTHYWFTGCQPLPEEDSHLFVLAQAHKATWASNKATILAIIADLAPAYAANWKERERKMNQLSRLGYATSSKRKAEALAKGTVYLPPAARHPKVAQENRAAAVAAAPAVDRDGFRERMR